MVCVAVTAKNHSISAAVCLKWRIVWRMTGACSSCNKRKEKSSREEKDSEILRLRKELEKEKAIVKRLLAENEEEKEKVRRLSAEKQQLKAKNNISIEDHSKVTSNTKPFNDVLVMGDSILRFSGEGCKIKGATVECFPGIRAEQLSNKIERMDNERKEKLVVIHVGTNNVKRAESSDHVVGEIYDLCNVARKKFSGAKIIVNGIIKRKYVSPGKIEYINRGISWVCKRQGINFVNPNSWVREWDLGRDGLHLNRRGTFNFGNCLSNSIFRCLQQGN